LVWGSCEGVACALAFLCSAGHCSAAQCTVRRWPLQRTACTARLASHHCARTLRADPSVGMPHVIVVCMVSFGISDIRPFWV